MTFLLKKYTVWIEKILITIMPITKIIKKLITKPDSKDILLPKIHNNKYQINQQYIPKNSIKIIRKLQKLGYETYLVGGVVRDLLLTLSPKDIDIATNAKPEQIRKAFKNCRLIGRRFRLAHLLFYNQIIEVATFRSANSSDILSPEQQTNSHGLIIRDNIYGSLEEDAWRRDFTINALYYDPINNNLIDYTKGFSDLTSKTIRIIGDPNLRYREDPVRMLRAIRFAAKLNFTIEEQTKHAITINNSLILHVSPVRLFDEIIKIMHSGYANTAYQLLNEFGFIKILFPQTYQVINHSEQAKQNILLTINNTDMRIKQSKTVNPAFIFAVLLWPVLQAKLYEIRNLKCPISKKHDLAASEAINTQNHIIAIAKKHIKTIKEIWSLQARLIRRRGKTPLKIINHPQFRAAYDFLIIIATNEPGKKQYVTWWQQFQTSDYEQQLTMLNELHHKKK